MAVSEKVKQIIAQSLNVDVSVLSGNTAIGDLPEWDSLHHLQIIATIEQEYGIQFEPDILMELETVDDIAAIVNKKVN